MKVVQPRLRRASVHDHEAILAIYHRAIERREIARHDRAAAVTEITAIAPSDDRYHTYVAEEPGSVCGWSAYRPWHQRAAFGATIELLVYVAPHHRGRGLATALVSQAIAAASRVGFRTMLALSLAGDAIAARLSRSSGFFTAGVLSQVCPAEDNLCDVTLYQRLLCANEAT